jgi:amino acid transporter
MATLDSNRAAPRMPSTGYLVKRLLLGRPLPTARLAHERLGKPTALAVFSSDNMSSVAYATEEILRILIPAVGLAAFTLVMPITLAVVVVEAVLIFSYRQTIKAYPSAGGAYIVTKDNLGLLPAQLAGVALLVDYVLTVAVSVAAGVQAISTVYPLSDGVRVVLSLLFVWLIAYANLLGVRESGRIFAVPTYVFIASLCLTCGLGMVRVLTGQIHAMSTPALAQSGGLTLGLGAVTMVIVLRAFASGGAAVTGVEAISNGVPAFRKPEWKNARTTLMYMGAVLSATFLAVSYLAHRLRVIPVADESKSVLGQIGQAVYGGGIGTSLFYVLQISTTLILILAANTSFADFPRLASFHAHDAFMPRQLTKRGHRLVFSNGIIGLAAAASLIVVLFRASVTRMIPLYALGVFTSFTLSQSGMAKRHLRLREPGWRRGLAINGIGAVTTLVVTGIIAVEKFSHGAWIIVVFVPVMVFVLTRVNRTYQAEEADLVAGLPQIERPLPGRHVAVVVVDELNEAAFHALQYAKTIHPQRVIALHLASGDESVGGAGGAFEREWKRTGLTIPLAVERCTAWDQGARLRAFLQKATTPDAQLTLIIPGRTSNVWGQRQARHRRWARVLRSLKNEDGINVVIVRDHGGRGHTADDGRLSIVPRTRHTAVILVDRLDRSVLKALRYARSIEALEIRAVHAGIDPVSAQELAERWADLGNRLEIPLDVDECFDRDIARTIRRYIGELQSKDSGAGEISVIIPRRLYPSGLHRLLHDRTGRAIARSLEADPHVDVVMVPYRLGAKRDGKASGPGTRALPPEHAGDLRVPATAASER